MTPEYDQNIDRIIYMLATKAAGELNAEELSELEAWKDIAPINRETADEVSVTGFTVDLLNNWKQEKADHSLGRVRQQIKRKNLRVLWPRIAAVAAVLLVVGAGLLFYTFYYAPRHLEGSGATRDLLVNDVKPGGNKAYLVLSNGKRLSLTDAANGELAKEAGVEITKTADGQVIYTAPGDPGLRRDDGRTLNTIETPRGGQYQIRLPDGSKVWLNAASKLIYPVSFTGRGQREVSLDGEAYFEISKNKLQPFVVKSKNQEVTVLGTHFNINSYSDEGSVKTTLLEGSVRISAMRDVNTPRHPEFISGSQNSKGGGPDLRQDDDRINSVVLKPGEQSVLQNNKVQVTQVNTEPALAWKNNQFMFESQHIESIMRMIARWYDVEIVYYGAAPTEKFGGAISKFQNVSKVLQILELTGSVHFKIEGKIIYVSK